MAGGIMCVCAQRAASVGCRGDREAAAARQHSNHQEWCTWAAEEAEGCAAAREERLVWLGWCAESAGRTAVGTAREGSAWLQSPRVRSSNSSVCAA